MKELLLNLKEGLIMLGWILLYIVPCCILVLVLSATLGAEAVIWLLVATAGLIALHELGAIRRRYKR